MKFKYNFLKNNYLLHKSNQYFKIIIILYLFIFFNAILLINRFLRNRKEKKEMIQHNKNIINVCLYVIGKGEKLYVKEYINYYEKLGYNHIFLYDNNDINGEVYEDIIQDELKKGFVSIINYRGKIGKRYVNGFKMDSQNEAYYDCYEKNNKFLIGYLFLILMNF